MEKFTPGQRVPLSGIYRVYHDSHRLMHEASLKVGETFPCCKQCGIKISFELVHSLRDDQVLPFSEGSLLKRDLELAKDQPA
jgi:hypothetical protein